MAPLGELRATVKMAEHMQKAELVCRLPQRRNTDEETAEGWVDAILETMYEVFKSGKSLSLPGFGRFYLDRRRAGTVFKFNPGQKLRALFGWLYVYQQAVSELSPPCAH